MRVSSHTAQKSSAAVPTQAYRGKYLLLSGLPFRFGTAGSLHSQKSEVVSMTARSSKWRLVPSLTVALCLGATAVAFSQFTSFNDRRVNILEGNWQSCREPDGGYAERIYDARLPGFGDFELHMGP